MLKNVTLALTLVTLSLFVGCGKDNQTNQPVASKAAPKATPPYSIIGIETTDVNGSTAITASTRFHTPNIFKQNCFKSEEIKKSAHRAFSIYNAECKSATDKNLVVTLVHNTNDNRLYTSNGTRPPVEVGSLLEIGMYPGPNVFLIRNLCGKLNKSTAKASCTFEVEASGKIKSGSFKTL
jgi:hypothetical protein